MADRITVDQIQILPDTPEERKSALESVYGPGYRKAAEKSQRYGFMQETIGPVTDEISGYTQAPIDWLYGQITGKPAAFSDLLDERLELARGAQREFREEHPIASVGANVLGGLAAGPARAVAGVAAPALSLGQKALTGAKVGAVGGGLAGAAEGEGALGRAETGAAGAALGAGIGAALPGGIDLMGRIVAGAKNIAGLKGAGATERARQMVIDALERDGISMADLAAREASGKPLTIADLGPNTRALVGAAGRRSGEGMKAVEDFYTGRSKGAFGRVEEDIAQGVGDPRAFRATDQALAAEKGKAGPLYKGLEGKTTPLDDDLKAFFKRPAARQAYVDARKWWANKGKAMPKDGRIPFEVLDQAKKSLDRMARYGKTAQGGAELGEVGAIRELKNELLTLADARFPGYATARKTSADPQQVRDALDAGRMMLREDAGDIAADFKSLSIPEREAFRLGAAKALRDKIARKSMTASTAKDFDNPKIQEQIKAIFPDEKTFARFMAAVDDERVMQETFDDLLRGSQTAARRVADEEFGQGAAGLGDAVIDTLSGKGLVRQGIDWAARVGQGAKDRVAYGLNERVGREVGDLATRTDLGDVATRLSATPQMGVPARLPGPQSPAPAVGLGAGAGRGITPDTQIRSEDIEIMPMGADSIEVMPEPIGLTTTGDHVNLEGVAEPVKRSFTALQAKWGAPLPITSGYRSPEYNASVGGAKKSRHMHGDALDISIKGMPDNERMRLIDMITKSGFTGIGIYDDSIHIDMGERRAWGPSRRRDSVPRWAEGLIRRHMTGVTG